MTLPRRFAARSLAVVLVLGLGAPLAATAQTSPAVMPVQVPTPAPMPTVSGTPIPYPAYGTPAPDVATLKERPGVPTTLTLNQAIDIAVAQSPSFASERAAYRAIAARYSSEKGALLPNISASGSIQRQYGSTSNGNNNASASPAPTNAPSNVYTTESGSVSLSELIFDGGRVIAGIRSAKEADIAGRDTLLRQLQALAYSVAGTYYTLLEDRASVTSDNALVHEFEINEQYVTAQIRTGAAARSDLAAAQFQTAQARGLLVTAQGQEIAAEGAFATTLGLDADTEVAPKALSSSPSQVKLLTYAESLKEAYTLRPDFLAAEYSVESDRENLRYAKLARFPSISANASLGTSRTLIQTPAVATPFSSTRSLGATISIPIYDQGLTNYNVATAAAALDQGKDALTSTRLLVQSDVRGGLANLISARATLVQARSEVASATVSLQATQAQYKVGASTITAIVTAEANLATAQRDYVAALYGERLAEENYAYVLGASDLRL
ncbi:MAG TPA: TolC family protein [Candidatus Aquilonibacter sp.]